MALITADSLGAAMMRESQRFIEQAIQEEADAAAERVRQRVNEAAPRLAMQIMRFFDVEKQADRFVITVRQPTENTNTSTSGKE